MTEFEISFPPEEVRDLQERLRATRWPQELGAGGGIPIERVRQLAEQWRTGFDWTACAQRLNAQPQFRVGPLHFLHAATPGAPAILMLHGWPGSFVEMLPLFPLLADGHSLVAPSLPGFGYSAATKDLTPLEIADALAALMTQLGYPRFFVHGGDVGAGVGTWLARRHPERVLGLHLNYIPGSYAPHAERLDPDEQRFLQDAAGWSDASGAYAHLQRTRPLTLAYGLEDSPVALLAWIAEKFDDWKDPQSTIDDDVLLANASVYWFSHCAHSSVRYYLESARTPHRFAAGERVLPPCGIARFPREEPFPPRAWIERAYDVRRFTVLPRGGHFAALEEPTLLAGDLSAFVAQTLAQSSSASDSWPRP